MFRMSLVDIPPTVSVRIHIGSIIKKIYDQKQINIHIS